MSLIDEKVWENIIGKKGSVWRKAFWWVVILLFSLAIATTLILLLPLISLKLFSDKKIISSVKSTIDTLTVKLNQVDIEEKVKAARIAGIEEAKIEQIKQTVNIPNYYERAEALARLAKEDY